MYEIEKVKLDLGNGNYAEIYSELKHRTQRAVAIIARQFLHTSDGEKITLGSNGGKVDAITNLEIDLEKIDYTATNDAIILNQVASWSFGEVTQEVLDELPERIHSALLKKCNELFQELPLATSDAVT